jgi:hypothetical protein
MAKFISSMTSSLPGKKTPDAEDAQRKAREEADKKAKKQQEEAEKKAKKDGT